MNKSNVIDITKRLKTKKTAKVSKTGAQKTQGSKAQVLSLVEHLEKNQKSERRKVARTVLSQFIGVFVLTNKNILQPVSVHDISIEGLSFDMVQDVGSYNIGETVTIRIYMSHDTYFSFSAKVANKRLIEERGVFRHGVLFKKDQPDALYHFARFLETVSQVVKKDTGEKVAGRVD